MSVDDIYLVSNRIEAVDPSEIDNLETAIGSLPRGYREFMARCGVNGRFCGNMYVFAPEVILKNLEKDCRTWSFEDLFRECEPGPMPKDDRRFHRFGGSETGDRLFYFPGDPGVLYDFMEDYLDLVRHQKGFHDATRLCAWGTDGHPFPYFNPAGSGRKSRSFDLKCALSTEEVGRIIEGYWSGKHGMCDCRRTMAIPSSSS
jgi:hypothetical protein